jgi:hypothetical protein
MKLLTEFFWNIHRSIADPRLYAEAAHFSVRHIWGYLAGLWLLSTLVLAVSHTYYFVKPVTGFAAHIGQAFRDGEITDGAFIPPRPSPYTVRPDLLARALQLAVGIPNIGSMVADSFMVVDTGGVIGLNKASSVYTLLTSTHIVLNPHILMAYSIPYTELFGRTGTFRIDPATVQAYIEARQVKFLFYFFLQDGMVNAANLLFSLVFLFLAAYILKFQNDKKWFVRWTLAIFAVTPIVAGTCIEAVAGTHVRGTWFFFAALSVLVLFRGIRSSMPDTREREKV